MKKLLIVESPAKAKTITKYLDNKYDVVASVGHVRDLPKSNKKAIDVESGFLPHYVISKGKEKVIDGIIKKAKKTDEVILATDPDREGEAIAWHLAEILKEAFKGSKKKPKIKRVTYQEITKEAIEKALENPRDIDQHLRQAQEARRVLDRLVGYDLSGLIWKKVRYGLSAGRVQSPALRILMEREREIRAFVPEKFWTITADTKNTNGDDLTLTCIEEPREEKEMKRILSVGEKGKWKVSKVKETQAKRSPKAPFITSTLQQTASSRLGYSPSRAMSLAQRLYESGLITYMRTDSTSLSSAAMGQITKIIKDEYGDEYLETRTFAKKSKNAQEAHEAIRPTDISKMSGGANDDQKKLYNLIWTRTVASQMASAKTLRTKIFAQVNDGEIPDFTVNGSRIIFDGFLRADIGSVKEDVILPKVEEGEELKLVEIKEEADETKPRPRYSEAGLIKELEKRGIGRPSTYASTIKTIIDRGYVEKEQRSLKPTDTGDVVSSFLEEHFENYINDTFTADLEDKLDDIATGEREYEKTLSEFYKPFTKQLKEKDKMDKITTLGEADKKWKCPECGASMVIKLGKAGKFMSCEKFPDCTGARTIEGKELEGPKETGEKCPKCKDGKLVERDGRFGRFISCDKYPKCKFIKEDPKEAEKKKTGITCPECGKGDMSERRGRFGVFYSCSEYPDCKYAIKAKPTGNKCPECGALMMEGTKTIPERCSDKGCKMHNPHKLEEK